MLFSFNFKLNRLQIGVITGSRSGKKVLESRPGVQERATAAMTAAGEEVSKILSEAKTGGELGNSNSNNRSEMTGENDKSFYGQNEFSNEPSTSNYNSGKLNIFIRRIYFSQLIFRAYSKFSLLIRFTSSIFNNRRRDSIKVG